ncbi:protein PIN-LIKES 1-like [Nicotiana sylvestris]|uniref:protein PIN-LIKES 1-like n=1 Tax=Nicotiana sylvestris TaxID=4096 RepID=UPI00388C37F6
MAIVGILVGVVSLLRKLMIGNEAPLHVIQSSASLLGEATIPAITLIVGANLLRGHKKSAAGMWVVMGVQVVRSRSSSLWTVAWVATFSPHGDTRWREHALFHPPISSPCPQQ